VARKNQLDAESVFAVTTDIPSSSLISIQQQRAWSNPVAPRQKTAVAVVDELLSTPGAVSGEEVDLLLDFRFQLRDRADADATLRLFCDLRRRLEQRHYLALYRIRRWLETNLVASVRSCQAAVPHTVAVKLDHYCVEAVRRVALCAGLKGDGVLLAPRVRFDFAAVPVGCA
jgi:hypothetical protein